MPQEEDKHSRDDSENVPAASGLAEDCLQVRFRSGDRGDIEVLDQEVEHVGGNEGRQ